MAGKRIKVTVRKEGDKWVARLACNHNFKSSESTSDGALVKVSNHMGLYHPNDLPRVRIVGEY